jgi:hypothetical protein
MSAAGNDAKQITGVLLGAWIVHDREHDDEVVVLLVGPRNRGRGSYTAIFVAPGDAVASDHTEDLPSVAAAKKRLIDTVVGDTRIVVRTAEFAKFILRASNGQIDLENLGRTP